MRWELAGTFVLPQWPAWRHSLAGLALPPSLHPTHKTNINNWEPRSHFSLLSSAPNRLKWTINRILNVSFTFWWRLHRRLGPFGYHWCWNIWALIARFCLNIFHKNEIQLERWDSSKCLPCLVYWSKQRSDSECNIIITRQHEGEVKRSLEISGSPRITDMSLTLLSGREFCQQ